MPQSFSKHEGVSQPYRENSSHSHRYANDRSSPGSYSHKPYDRPASTHGLPNVAPSAHHPHSARTNYSLDRSSHTRFHIPSGFKTKAQAKKDTTPSSDFQQSLPSKNPQNLAGTKKIPNSSNVGTALTCKYSSTRTYWCDLPGQGLLIEFGDSWILELVNDGGDREANCVGSGKAQRWKVAVPGICPFHVVAKKQTNNVTDCGGIAGHSHEPLVAGPKHNVAVTGSSLMLKQPLVTMPMPMHALLMSSELRSSSLYYYLDPTFKTKYPDFYANLADKSPAFLPIVSSARLHQLANPVCYRLLQQKACERRWMLDDEYQYSVSSWASRIGSKGMLVNCRGNQVPYPQNPQFRSDSCAYKMSFGFWTPFQQEMWNYFLDVHTGPCFLDAAFDLQKDGFQLWTLFFELGNLTVPISFMVTTSLTMKLLYDWLSEIASFRPKVPKKTIYVNTMKAHELIGPILPDWDVRYAKYYIAQELRELVLRSDCAEPYDASVISSVQSINSNFLSSFKALLPVSAILTKMNYIFSMVSEWLPKTTAEMALFDHSADAISRWRYQLWMTMLGRPSNQRVDTVLYYLHSVFIPGVEKSFRERKDQNASPIPFNMDGMEHGSSPLHKSVCELRTKPLGGSLVCLSEDRELAQKVIVDLDLQVCFCEKFMQSKTCPHLVFCMPSAIHHPMLPRLLHDIPRA